MHLFDLISVQPFSTDEPVIWYSHNNTNFKQPVRVVKTRLTLEASVEDQNEQSLSEIFALEITRTFLSELFWAPKFTLSFNGNFNEAIEIMAIKVASKLSQQLNRYQRPNWMIVSPNLINHESQDSTFLCSFFKTNTNISGMQVYVDKLMGQNRFLVGYKGNDLEAGIIYTPYSLTKINQDNKINFFNQATFSRTPYGMEYYAEGIMI